MGSADLLNSQLLVKIAVLVLTALVSFYLGKHWSDAAYPQLVFYNASTQSTDAVPRTPSVALSPNADLSIDLSALTRDDEPPLPPPPPLTLERVGIVDDNGTMRENFDAGEFDPDLMGGSGGGGAVNETERGGREVELSTRVKIGKFSVCPESLREYIPCLDNEEEIKKLKSTERGERFERHCPAEGKGLDCLVPPPKDYKTPIPWPQSRDEVG